MRRRVAIVGVGRMGRRHARIFAASARFELTAIADTDMRAAADAVATWGGTCARSEREAIAAADLVIVATPIPAHATVVAHALSAGRDVFVEKPITLRLTDARELLGLAARAGRRLFVGHSERFNPVVRALVREVAPADVLAVELRRMGAAKALGDRLAGPLVSLGVHDLDLVAYLTRSPLALRHAVGRDEVAHVLVRAANGAAGHVHVDQAPGRAPRRSLAVTTRAHVWDGDLLDRSLVRTCRATGARTVLPLDDHEPLAVQAEALADALDGRASEIATGIDGARALLLAERAGTTIRSRTLPVVAEKL